MAARAGLFLDEWQQLVLRRALGERVDGKWSAFEVGLVVPRQNGKNSVLEALELAAVFLWDVRLVVHSAHKFDTSQEHFWRMKALIENCPELCDQMPAGPNRGFYAANGKESIRLANGNRVKFIARSGGAARGFTGDLIVFDEAYDLPARALGSMIPALAARSMVVDGPGVQIWYTSSAPHRDSQVLHGLVKRGRTGGDAGRLAYFEWGNEPGTAPDDWDAIAAANPGLGIRISPEFIDDERMAMSETPDEFDRERLGVAEEPDAGARVFGPGVWASCEDPASRPVGRARWALDVHPDLEWSSFDACAARADGLMDVAVLDRRRGTGWVVERAGELRSKFGALQVDPRSAAGGLIDALRAAKVEVHEVSTAELTKACAALRAGVHDGLVRHRGQGPLDSAVAGAAVRTVGEAWAWARLSSQVDISPLVAVTLAYGVAVDPPAATFAY